MNNYNNGIEKDKNLNVDTKNFFKKNMRKIFN